VDTHVTTYYKPLPPKKYFPLAPYQLNKTLFSVSSQIKTTFIFQSFIFNPNNKISHNKAANKAANKQHNQSKKNFLALF